MQSKLEVGPEEVVGGKRAANTCRPSFCFSSDDEDDEDSIPQFNQIIHKRIVVFLFFFQVNEFF